MTVPSPTAPRALDSQAGLILTFCCMIWGGGIVMAKVANTGISPVLNAGLRSIVSCLIIFAWASARGVPLWQNHRTFWTGWLCGAVFSVEFLLLYAGLVETSAARGTLFLHASPFVAAVGEHRLGHRLSAIRALGLVAAFFGLAVVFGERLTIGSSAASLIGDLLCLGAGILWGATTVIVKATELRKAPAEKILLYQLAASGVLLAAVSFLIGEPGIVAPTPQVLGAFAYTVLAVASFGYLTWFWLMRTYSAASLHAFTFLTPIFGVLASNVIMGDPLTPGLLSGLTLVALGIWLVNRPAQAAAAV